MLLIIGPSTCLDIIKTPECADTELPVRYNCLLWHNKVLISRTAWFHWLFCAVHWQTRYRIYNKIWWLHFFFFLTLPSEVEDVIKLFSARRLATFTPSSLSQRRARLPCSSNSGACKKVKSNAVNQAHNMSPVAIWTNRGLSKVRFRAGSPQLGKLCKSLNAHFDTVLWERAAVTDGRP